MKPPYRVASLPLPVANTFFRQETGQRRLAIVYPGRGYTCQGPLLYYPVNLALDHGCDVLQVEYRYDASFDRLSEEDREHRFEKDVLSSFDAAAAQREYHELILIGKSLGTRALALLDERRGTAIRRFERGRALWLTPLFADDGTFARMKACELPSLYVAGGLDRGIFIPERAEELARSERNRIVLVEGGDHSLDIAGDVRRSISELGRVLDECERFLFKV